MEQVFDFREEIRDPIAFLCEMYWRDIFEDGCWSPLNMSPDELSEAILGDILAFDMWQQQTGNKVDVTQEEILRHVKSEVCRIRVIDALQKLEDSPFVKYENGIYTIPVEHRQAVMNHIGNWYTGYQIPGDTVAVKIDREKMGEMIRDHGGIEQLASSMAMDIGANSGAVKTLH